MCKRAMCFMFLRSINIIFLRKDIIIFPESVVFGKVISKMHLTIAIRINSIALNFEMQLLIG